MMEPPSFPLRFKMVFLRKNLLLALAFIMFVGLGVQTYIGEHGLQARSTLNAHLSGLNKKLQLLQKKRVRLEHVTKLLAPGAVDRDMLEYQARELLDFVYEDELIYVQKEPIAPCANPNYLIGKMAIFGRAIDRRKAVIVRISLIFGR